MFSAIRRRFTYANVAVTLALVFAMSGGAYAASRYVITSTKQISPKALKALKGANGKDGAAGPAGAQGAQGAQGPQGPAGAKGETGATGAQGLKGETGAAGKNGTTGFTSTLPSGKTEMGAWTASNPKESIGFASISFDIPLAAAPAAHYVKAGESTAPNGCTGNAEDPGAEPGNLCVFATLEGGYSEPFKLFVPGKGPGDLGGEYGAGTTGAGLIAESGAGEAFAYGTWAVTAE